VSGAGTGYGTVGTESNTKIIATIDQLNAEYQNALSIIREAQQMMSGAAAQEQANAIDQARQIAERKAQLEAESRRVADETAASAAAASNYTLKRPTRVSDAAPAAAAAAAVAAATTNAATVTTPRVITAVAPAAAQVTNFTYTLDFHDNQFWLTRSDGVLISNGSADWKSAEIYVAPQNIALSSVSVTPAAAAKFAANSGTVATTGAVATSTSITGTTHTTNQITGTTTVTNPTTGVTATTNPATGTTTVVATSSDTGKLALYALLGVLLLRGAVK
jgi:hypothetical protein